MPQGIEVRADGWSTDDLYEESDVQFAALIALDALIDKVSQWVLEATDATERARLWDQYSGLCRDYRILMSWYQVTYAAAVFSESGSDLKSVTVDGVLAAGYVFNDH